MENAIWVRFGTIPTTKCQPLGKDTNSKSLSFLQHLPQVCLVAHTNDMCPKCFTFLIWSSLIYTWRRTEDVNLQMVIHFVLVVLMVRWLSVNQFYIISTSSWKVLHQGLTWLAYRALCYQHTLWFGIGRNGGWLVINVEKEKSLLLRDPREGMWSGSIVNYLLLDKTKIYLSALVG